jgi:hypothetical protein
MSFIYSQALVAASSQDKCSGIDAFVPSSGNPTHKPSSSPDKTTAAYRLSRFGMTCELLTADRGAELLTSWLAGFPVRTSALPGKAQGSTANGQACGDTWRASLARFDPASASWRTAQPSLLGDSDECSVTWPRSGMTAGGQCWGLPMSGRRTKETDFGYLLPTPCSSDPQLERRAKNGEHYTTETGTVRRINADGTSSNLGLAASARMWPTPTSVSGHQVGRLDEWGGSHSRAVMRTLVTPEELGGSLNPSWVEWLMGWPVGWTDLKPLETVKFHSAPLQRSSCSVNLVTEVCA